jgi:hypothetical protein
MRQLFLVFAKLLGLLQLYYGVIALVQTAPALFIMQTEFHRQFIPSLVGMIFVFVVSLGMAWILLVQTEWLADKLKLQDATEITELKENSMLCVGVILIGVYVTVQAIPVLVGSMVRLGAMWTDPTPWFSRNTVISSVLQLGIGVFLMLQSTKVIEIITRRKDTAQPTDAADPESTDRPLDQ